MAVTDMFAGEIAAELLKMLVSIARKSTLCKSTAEQLIATINELFPIIQEIQYSGVELPANRQSQLNHLSETLRGGVDLARRVLGSSRWNVYKNLQLARKMEKLEKSVSRFLRGTMQAHVLADVHHLRFDAAERFDRLDGSARRLELRLGSMKLKEGAGGLLLEEAVMRMEEEEEESLVSFGAGMALQAKKSLKEMLLGRADGGIFGIHGIGGSGKTTLARELARDDEVRCYFKDRILFLTVSQSPDVEQLKVKIWGHIAGDCFVGANDQVPQWKLNTDAKIQQRKTLIILDDVWSLSVLDQLIFRIPGCKTLVVSRFKFPTVLHETYELELMAEKEAVSLFCYFAFGQKSIPPAADEKLVKQVVHECKGLPLALKVIGASLKGQSEMFWKSAKFRLTRAEPICESHEIKLLERMAISIDYLPPKVREFFLDLGSFPEDKKIPLDVIMNLWVELHDLDEEEAFAILVELSDKNLITLVKDARAGDMYSSYYEISVCMHDVLRDLALHLSNRGNINERRRLFMPRRENGLPKEWERNMDQQFNAQIVSIHTGEMKEMDWFAMEFPKAEVLIINFSSSEYILPSFIGSMPKLRALILINYGNSVATVHNLSVVHNLANLRSLWFEKISICHPPGAVNPLRRLRKISLVLCRIDRSVHQSEIDLPKFFPCLSDLTMDHCEDLTELPSSISGMHTLTSLSITNCSLQELPWDLGKLSSLQILRLYACPSLKTLPTGICELFHLQYLDISQCVNLRCLPEGIGGLIRLEKIDMRECKLVRNLPKSASMLRSLRRVICDESLSWLWKDLGLSIPSLHVQVGEECFNLDWLSE